MGATPPVLTRYLVSEAGAVGEQLQIFGAALALATFNDSLRARIYARYSYIASNLPDPSQRARLIEKANALYEEPK